MKVGSSDFRSRSFAGWIKRKEMIENKIATVEHKRTG